ncbi:hypothetical protein C8R44DRAFT_797362 [Mycena epipterygia]|nr:hypothetical protein C8R44DRAFT_797362 [Mycena epipterygia]
MLVVASLLLGTSAVFITTPPPIPTTVNYICMLSAFGGPAAHQWPHCRRGCSPPALAIKAALVGARMLLHIHKYSLHTLVPVLRDQHCNHPLSAWYAPTPSI